MWIQLRNLIRFNILILSIIKLLKRNQIYIRLRALVIPEQSIFISFFGSSKTLYDYILNFVSICLSLLQSPMQRLYRHVFPALLQLACDVEQVARQLFEPLVMQLIHWFTGNKKFESEETVTFLNAMLEGVVHPTHTALRDFSARCLKEFLKWSIKQTSKKVFLRFSLFLYYALKLCPYCWLYQVKEFVKILAFSVLLMSWQLLYALKARKSNGNKNQNIP